MNREHAEKLRQERVNQPYVTSEEAYAQLECFIGKPRHAPTTQVRHAHKRTIRRFAGMFRSLA